MPAPRSLASLCVAASIACSATAQYTGEWPLDETNGFVAGDISGNSNDGMLNNFVVPNAWVTGMYGNSLQFDGFDDYVSLTSQTSVYDGLGSPYSVCYWVKGSPQNNAFVYAEGSLSTIAILVFGSGQYTAQSDRFRVYCRNDQGNVPFTGFSNAVVYDNTWHHVCFVDNSGQITLYVDGVVDTANISYDPGRLPGSPGHGTFTLNTASVGALRRGTVCCYTNAQVDDFRLYRFAMSPTDVLIAMAGAPLVPPSGSIGEYGVGCGTGPLDIVGSGSAQIGGPGIALDLQSGQPGGLALLALGLGPITPLDLGGLGYSGCTLYPQSPLLVFAGVVDAAGNAPQTVVPVPNNSSLAMAQFNAQGVSLVGSALEFSDVVLATLGN